MTIEHDALRSAVASLLATYPPATTPPFEFLRAQFDAGLAYVHFPPGYGGLGLDPTLQSVIDDELAAHDAPPSGRVTNRIASGQGAASVMTYGTESQKQRYLRPLFTGELIGCQLFSEPGAGSDLASLATQAVRDGDTWIVNGQKVWTSRAHDATWGVLLARTDPTVPKHQGLTQFVIDMTAPGVEVRPLRDITGSLEFNEVFLDNVRVPDSERLGPIGKGWTVAQHTLSVERYNIWRVTERASGPIAPAIHAWQARHDKTSPHALVLKDELMRHWIATEVHRLLQWRASVTATTGNTGPEGSVVKLSGSTTTRNLDEWAPTLLGPAATLITDYRPHPTARGDEIQRAFVRSPRGGIAGGTDHIQRNIIAERVLGLPRDTNTGSNTPWNQTPRT